MSAYEELIYHMLETPPDPHEYPPVANRRATIFGVMILFLLLAWLAVFFRLYVRIKVLREPGLDDAFVLAAVICSTVATAYSCASVKHGLGRHMIALELRDIQLYSKYYWIECALYIMEAALIKISLLLQFLRIFKAGLMWWTCTILLVAVSLWGTAFSFIAWFPCFPVQGYWDRRVPAHCYGFGLANVAHFVNTYKAHSASNMAFDIAIFLTPLVLFGRPSLKAKNLLAMAGIFTFGATVVAASVWRLYVITVHQAATYPYFDITWWTPLMLILSAIEVNLAVICASTPIFWPMIETQMTAIFVSYEVNVTEERIGDDYGLAYELEHTKSGRQGSVKSSGGTSIEGLTRENNNDDEQGKMPKYSIGIDPLGEDTRYGNGFQATVQTQPKDNWAI